MDEMDHRAIGNRMELFHQQDDGPGMIFWHPRGWTLWRLVENDIRRRMRAAGYQEVRTPQLMARSLWEKSGHWEKFGAAMFEVESEGRSFALKPMSCPGHVQLFNKRLRSHRDLPVRYAEFGACHRFEPSGSLQGLMRTRAFVQDDAHVLCAVDQVEDEVLRFSRLLSETYADFGFDGVEVGFSTRPPVRAGDDALWDRAEAMLAGAATAAGLRFRVQPGEGAFYGPKLEFSLADNRGRRWQCGTIQLDFVLPGRLGASYATNDNGRAEPVLIHHAVLGSLERFIAILLEHWEGHLPPWLAPEQVTVASIGRDQASWARQVAGRFGDRGLRVVLDDSDDTLSRKIVSARDLGIPLMAAVGRREAASGTVALRGPDGRPEVLPLEDAIGRLQVLCRGPADRIVRGEGPGAAS